MNNLIPKWVTIVSGLIALLGIFVSGSLYFSPEAFIKDVDFSAAGVFFLIQMWAARQVAITAIIAFSVIKQSVPMLKIALMAYALVTFQDILIGVFRGDNQLIFGSAFFCALAIAMFTTLMKKKAE